MSVSLEKQTPSYTIFREWICLNDFLSFRILRADSLKSLKTFIQSSIHLKCRATGKEKVFNLWFTPHMITTARPGPDWGHRQELLPISLMNGRDPGTEATLHCLIGAATRILEWKQSSWISNWWSDMSRQCHLWQLTRTASFYS